MKLSRQAVVKSGLSESVCFNCVFLVGICSLSSTEWSSLWCVKAQCLKPWSWTEKSTILCTGQRHCTSVTRYLFKMLVVLACSGFWLFFQVSVWEPKPSTCVLPLEDLHHTTGLFTSYFCLITFQGHNFPHWSHMWWCCWWWWCDHIPAGLVLVLTVTCYCSGWSASQMENRGL